MGWIYCLVPKLATKTVCPRFSTVLATHLLPTLGTMNPGPHMMRSVSIIQYYWCRGGRGHHSAATPHLISNNVAQFVVRNHRYNISLVRNSFVAASSAAAAVQ